MFCKHCGANSRAANTCPYCSNAPQLPIRGGKFLLEEPQPSRQRVSEAYGYSADEAMRTDEPAATQVPTGQNEKAGTLHGLWKLIAAGVFIALVFFAFLLGLKLGATRNQQGVKRDKPKPSPRITMNMPTPARETVQTEKDGEQLPDGSAEEPQPSESLPSPTLPPVLATPTSTIAPTETEIVETPPPTTIVQPQVTPFPTTLVREVTTSPTTPADTEEDSALFSVKQDTQTEHHE